MVSLVRLLLAGDTIVAVLVSEFHTHLLSLQFMLRVRLWGWEARTLHPTANVAGNMQGGEVEDQCFLRLCFRGSIVSIVQTSRSSFGGRRIQSSVSQYHQLHANFCSQSQRNAFQLSLGLMHKFWKGKSELQQLHLSRRQFIVTSCFDLI